MIRVSARLKIVVTGLVFGLVAPLLSTSPTLAAGCNSAGRIVKRAKGWSTVRRPDFPPNENVVPNSNVGQLQEIAVDPYDPKRIFAHDLASVMRTIDGGCTWKRVWSVPVVPSPEFPFSQNMIRAIEIPEAKSARNRIYLTLSPTIAPPQVNVVVSKDGGESWKLSSEGLPPGAWLPYSNSQNRNYGGVRVAPSAPNVLYLPVTLNTPISTTLAGRTVTTASAVLYGSTDAGATWELLSELPTGPVDGLGKLAAELVVNPSDPKDVWMYTRLEMLRSRDGGKSWVEVAPFGNAGSDGIAISHPSGKATRVVFLPAPDANASFLYLSDDGGKSWTRLASPAFIDAVAFGGHKDQLLVVSRDGYFRYEARAAKRGAYPWSKSIPYSTASAVQLDVTRTKRPVFLGTSKDEIHVYSGKI